MALDTSVGTETSEAYCDVAYADAYFDARNNATWAALTVSDKEAALRLGCDYMEANYALLWCGEKTSETQALSWPRTGTSVASDVIPVQVQRANAELAVRSSASGGNLQTDQGAAVKEETVGPITVIYQDGAKQVTKYSAVDNMLQSSGLMCRGFNQIAVVRA